MRIAEMKAHYLERLDLYQKEIEAYALGGGVPDEFETFYVEHYRSAVTHFFDKVVPDEGTAYGVNVERMHAIAWQHSRYAWRRMEHALQAGFGSLSGYVSARAEAAAENEWAENMHDLAEGSWVVDMGARIPSR